jgi:hypothetical protein
LGKNSENSKIGDSRATEPPDKKQKVDIPPPPVVGTRPIFDFCIAGHGVEETRVRVLLDWGSQIAVISDRFCMRYAVPRVQRDVPVPIKDFADRVLPGSGKAYTYPLKLRYDDHISEDTFEVAPMDEEVDVMLQFWWIAKHPPTGVYENTLSFSHPKCINCTEEKHSKIDLEWDERIIHEKQYWDTVRVCGVVQIDDPKGLKVQKPVLEALPKCYHKWLKVFDGTLAQPLPPHRQWDHAIDLKDNSNPPWGPIYPLSEIELKALREYLDEMLAAGKIRPSKSPAGAPILFVPKPHGRGLRLCVDYRNLNRVTIMNRYPLPLMRELQDRTRKAKFFSKIDLKNGYNLVRIKKGDEWKTAFRTRYGHYEYLVMPFGLANAPATFQNMIHDILRDLLDRGVIAYLDDILIYSETEEEHEALLAEVLSRLEKYSLAAAIDKCEFHKRSIDFLGYVVSEHGLEMAKDKVESILQWKEPSRDIKDVQSFLGFANFYRRFIHNFSGIVKPLTDTLKGGGSNFKWTRECGIAFRRLKQMFTSAPILRHFDSSLPIRLETDASDFAIGAVLSQPFEGRWHPVAFFSRKMDSAERNYDIHDKEMLAIVSSFKEWRPFLEGALHQIEIFTDHKNLEYFMTTKILNRRQARWAQELSNYDFKIIYRKGSSNGKADALSRRSEYRPLEGGSDGMEGKVLKPSNIDIPSIEARYVSSARLAAIKKFTWKSDFLQLVKEAANNDEDYLSILANVKAGKGEDHIEEQDELLYWKHRLWVPNCDNLKLRIAQEEHDSKIAGHFGQDKTLELVNRNYYWPKLDQWIAGYVRGCHKCQQNKASRHAKYGLLHSLELPASPWSSISMDFIEQLPETADGYSSVWVVVDRFTKMSHFIPLKGKPDAHQLATIFAREVWRLHGLPSDIVSDRDSRFTSKFWQSLLEILDIKGKMSTAFHPQTDGQTERINQILEAYVRAFCSYDQNDWADILPFAEYAYNNSASSATNFSPFYANYGFHPRTSWGKEPEDIKNPTAQCRVHWTNEVHSACKENLARARERMGKYYDQKRTEAPMYKVGDLIMLDMRNIKTRRPTRKFDHKKQGPFTVVKVISRSAVKVELPKRWKIHDVFHVSLLEPYRQSTVPGQVQPTPDEVLRQAGELQEGADAFSDEYTPEEIMECKRWGRTIEYLVRWEGFPARKDWTWEPWEHLVGCKDLVKGFKERNPEAPVHDRLLR